MSYLNCITNAFINIKSFAFFICNLSYNKDIYLISAVRMEGKYWSFLCSITTCFHTESILQIIKYYIFISRMNPKIVIIRK